uniref:F-box domain-containing protein n=1 Tax=Chenopodium quinoa TaxID=63459 RepID=A0A803MHF6_CHEQI
MVIIPPWTDLPDELLSDISKRLDTNPLDILSFRSVCHSWLSSSPFSLSYSPQSLFSPLPLITPSPPDPLLHRYAIPNSNASLLSGTAIFALRPQFDPDDTPSCMANAWVLFLDQPKIDKVSIRKPFSQSPYSRPMNFPNSIDLLKYRITELGRFYNLTNLPEDGGGKVSKPRDWLGDVLKVVLISNGDDFAVVVLSHEGKLGFIRLGFGDSFENLNAETDWEIIHDGRGFRFDDIVELKGRVLGIDRRGRMSERVKTLLTELNRLDMRIPRNPERLEVLTPPLLPPFIPMYEVKVNALHPKRKMVALEKLKKVCYVNKMVLQAREIDKLLKRIEKISVSWKQHCKSANLQNRVGTALLAKEESCASLESFRIVQNAIKHGKSKFDLLSLEVKIHTCLLQLEEDTTEAKGTLNPALFLLYSWLGWEHKVV